MTIQNGEDTQRKNIDKKRAIIGVSGASGICLADAVLRSFHAKEDWETYLIVSRQAKRTIELEFAPGLSALEKQADVVCDPGDLACSVSSGTFRTEGMVIVPCSMKTLAGLVSGYSEDLLLRAADVVLKERRQLTLVPREAPLSVLHCRNLLSAVEQLFRRKVLNAVQAPGQEE